MAARRNRAAHDGAARPSFSPRRRGHDCRTSCAVNAANLERHRSRSADVLDGASPSVGPLRTDASGAEAGSQRRGGRSRGRDPSPRGLRAPTGWRGSRASPQECRCRPAWRGPVQGPSPAWKHDSSFRWAGRPGLTGGQRRMRATRPLTCEKDSRKRLRIPGQVGLVPCQYLNFTRRIVRPRRGPARRESLVAPWAVEVCHRLRRRHRPGGVPCRRLKASASANSDENPVSAATLERGAWLVRRSCSAHSTRRRVT